MKKRKKKQTIKITDMLKKDSKHSSATADWIQEEMKDSDDFHIKTMEKYPSLLLAYCETLIDEKYIDRTILTKLAEENVKDTDLINEIPRLFQTTDLSKKLKEEIIHSLLTGSLLFIIDDTIYQLNILDIPLRNVEETSYESSIRGPRDGFVEDLNTNISLIRRRLKSSSLAVEIYVLGNRSKTRTALLYFKDVINPDILQEIKTRISNIDIDIMVSTQQLEELMKDNPYSLFPLFDSTGRPDFVIQTLNQGRFALIVDGSPTASIAPVNLPMLINSPEDATQKFIYSSFQRILRLFSLFLATLLPGLWIALVGYNVEQIPYQLVATISISRVGLPLSPAQEMFITLVLFELFNEAGVRLPKAVGQTVAVLGGLIVGDAAIRSGLTSPSMLVVASITFVSSYTLVNQSLTTSITLTRFLILFLSTFFGLLGFISGFLGLVIYLATLSSFGVPYLSNFAPFSWKEIIGSLLKKPAFFYKKRAASTMPQSAEREGNE